MANAFLRLTPRLGIYHLCLLWFFVTALEAQQRQPWQKQIPRLAYVYPAGAQAGSTLRVVVGGQFLAEEGTLHFSVPGLEARAIESFRPYTQKEFNDLREKMETLQKRRQEARKSMGAASTGATWTPEDEKAYDALRLRMAQGRPNRQANPALAETKVYELKLPSGLKPGFCELRMQTEGGLSNPLRFVVDVLPEISVDKVQAKPGHHLQPNVPLEAVERTETQVAPPCVINGQILPGGVDRFRFHAQKGQTLVAALSARNLIPYLADAVPGWFQGLLVLYNEKGIEVASQDDFRFHPDPTLCFEVPQDGLYTIEVRDAIFRGREDFVYRLRLGVLPFLASTYPLGGRVGERVSLEFTGWNLPSTRQVFDASGRLPELFQLSLRAKGCESNPVLLELSEVHELLEGEAGAQGTKSESLEIPCVANGRLLKRGERDLYRCALAAGASFVAEIKARRLGSPLDARLRLLDAEGAVLAQADDCEDRSSGALTHHADPKLEYKVAQSGDYLVEVTSAQHQAGPDQAYRLHLRMAQPDFEVFLEAASLNLRSGEYLPVLAHVVRREGFSGEVKVSLAEDLESLFSLQGASIPVGQDRVRFTLGCRDYHTQRPVPLRWYAEASLGGIQVRRPVRIVENRMQAFFYQHLLGTQGSWVQVLEALPQRPYVTMESEGPLQITPGKVTFVDLRVEDRRRRRTPLLFELSEPPEGMRVAEVQRTFRGATLRLETDPGKTPAGLRGNLVFTVTAEYERPQKDKKSSPADKVRIPLGFTEALPFEVRGQVKPAG